VTFGGGCSLEHLLGHYAFRDSRFSDSLGGGCLLIMVLEHRGGWVYRYLWVTQCAMSLGL